LNSRLARRDLLTLIIVRIVPLASFTLINMAAGASNIRFRDFIVGSAIGLLPGILGISLFMDQLAATLREPDLPAFALLAAIIGVIVVSGWSFWRWEERHRNSRPGVPAD
jgi:phospholipase D1/2